MRYTALVQQGQSRAARHSQYIIFTSAPRKVFDAFSLFFRAGACRPRHAQESRTSPETGAGGAAGNGWRGGGLPGLPGVRAAGGVSRFQRARALQQSPSARRARRGGSPAEVSAGERSTIDSLVIFCLSVSTVCFPLALVSLRVFMLFFMGGLNSLPLQMMPPGTVTYSFTAIHCMILVKVAIVLHFTAPDGIFFSQK